MNDRGSLRYVFLLTLVAALGGLLFGYDTAVISGAIGFLQEHFHLDPQYMTGWAAACALIGCALGAGMAGLLSDRFGRRGMLIVSALLFLISAVGTAFPQTIAQFIIFRIIGGLGIGAASMTSPMYIAEIAPADIRGRMVSVNQFAIVSGMLVVYFVNFFIAEYGKEVDRRNLIAYVERHGGALDAKKSREFIDAKYLQADVLPRAAQGEPDRAKREALSAALDDFFRGDPANFTGRNLGKLLAEHGIQAEAKYLDMKIRDLPRWNEISGWRWMFGSGILPSVLFLLLLFLVPESPRWLIAKNRESEALAILARVGGAQHAGAEAAEIREMIARETGSLRQLFEPGMRMVLVIGVVLAILQQVVGINVFLYFAPKIFEKLGSETNAALWEQAILGAVNMFFTIVAIWTVDRLGRKPLMLIGAWGMAFCLVSMGFVVYGNLSAHLALVFILGYIACFALSVGPVVWVVLSEIFPTSIRGRAMAIATVCLWIANYFVTQTFTMMNDSPYLAKKFNYAFPFWVYAVFCGVMLWFVWRFVPETKGKTLEEIERGWLKG